MGRGWEEDGKRMRQAWERDEKSMGEHGRSLRKLESSLRELEKTHKMLGRF